MKGDMVLEYPFKMFLYMVVFLVVVGLILTLSRTHIDFCKFTPQGCENEERCATHESTETVITEAILRKYCDSCWAKTGKIDYKEDCLCYVVTGDYSPISFTYSNCELNCIKNATAIKFSYDSLLKKIQIKC